MPIVALHLATSSVYSVFGEFVCNLFAAKTLKHAGDLIYMLISHCMISRVLILQCETIRKRLGSYVAECSLTQLEK